MGTNLANNKVLLLGYTGYIGATLAKVLLEKNIQVVCPVRNKKPPKKNENIVFKLKEFSSKYNNRGYNY